MSAVLFGGFEHNIVKPVLSGPHIKPTPASVSPKFFPLSSVKRTCTKRTPLLSGH